MAGKLVITPKTKVGELLSAYPELEDVLINLSPQFRKLKNPVLRRTVGKVATLQQVAGVGNLSINHLVNTLRDKVGQGDYDAVANDNDLNFTQPSWFSSENIGKRLDVRPLIDKGENPLPTIMQNIKELPDNQTLELINSFVPAPVIQQLTEKGYQHWVLKKSDDEIHTYFKKF